MVPPALGCSSPLPPSVRARVTRAASACADISVVTRAPRALCAPSARTLRHDAVAGAQLARRRVRRDVARSARALAWRDARRCCGAQGVRGAAGQPRMRARSRARSAPSPRGARSTLLARRGRRRCRCCAAAGVAAAQRRAARGAREQPSRRRGVRDVRRLPERAAGASRGRSLFRVGRRHSRDSRHARTRPLGRTQSLAYANLAGLGATQGASLMRAAQRALQCSAHASSRRHN